MSDRILSSPSIVATTHDAFASGVQSRTYQASANAPVVRWVPDSARRILDVGCGAGGNAMALARADRVIDGVTYSAEEARSAGSFCRSVHVWDLEKGLPGALEPPYDAAICSHVLEHICFPARMLEDIHAALVPGGKLIVAVPNLLVYRHRMQLLLGKFEYTEGGIMDSTHFRWYTLASLGEQLGRHGFRVEHTFGAGIVPLGPLRRLLGRLSERVDRAACGVLPGLFGFQLVAVASRMQRSA